MAFPTSRATGKDGKVFMNTGDGALQTLTAMTKQTSYTYKGVTYTSRVYLLGTGKTLINTRPAKEAVINIDGISGEVVIAPHASNDKLTTTAFTIIVDGVESTVTADTDVDFTRPAVTQGAWVAVHVTEAGAVACTKGTDTTDAGGITGLVDTFGAGAGQIPLIAVDKILLGLLKVTNGAAVLLQSEIFYNHQERSDTVVATLLPNIGGVLLNAAMDAMHTGAIARDVKFTGYYLDNALVEIGTAKEWSLTPSTSTVNQVLMGGSASQTEISGWAFTFSQLATDPLVKNAMLNRQGFMAVRLQYPNGGYWQGVGSGAGAYKCAPGSFNDISVSGSLSDDPVFT